MKMKHIYLKDDYKIDRHYIFINEQKLANLIEKLDDYYANKGSLQISYGHLPYSNSNSNRVIEIESLGGLEEHKSKVIDLIDSPFVIYKYYDFIPIRLSLILRQIIDTNNPIKLSYLINELYNFKPFSQTEKKIYNEALSYINTNLHNSKLDITRIILNKLYNLDNNDVDYSYIDDSIYNFIDKLPYKK